MELCLLKNHHRRIKECSCFRPVPLICSKKLVSCILQVSTFINILEQGEDIHTFTVGISGFVYLRCVGYLSSMVWIPCSHLFLEGSGKYLSL